jgi:glycosyltransferase involved in cell wall biosynthesis
MKRIVIVNNNMKVGGVQKSLYNLLWSLDGEYDVTLCLLRATGVYLDMLPANVNVVQCSGAVKYLSMSQGECRGIHKLLRGGLAFLCRLFGRDRVMKLMLLTCKKLPGEYDCAMAFLHNGTISSFYGGVQEFVLKKVNARKKAAFLHCDYGNCGANHPRNNKILMGFDRISACSEGCREAFLNCLPELEQKCVTLPNFHRYDEIRRLAQPAVGYEPGAVHGVCVARLAHEKGIERAIAATAVARDAGFDFRLHLVGSGGMEGKLRALAEELNLKKAARHFGEKKIEMIPHREITNVTGYIKGGCSPVGMKKLFRTAIHSSASGFETIIVSAGKVGLQMEVPVAALLEIAQAQLAEIAG